MLDSTSFSIVLLFVFFWGLSREYALFSFLSHQYRNRSFTGLTRRYDRLDRSAKALSMLPKLSACTWCMVRLLRTVHVMLRLIGQIFFAMMVSTIYSALVLPVFLAGIVFMYVVF